LPFQELFNSINQAFFKMIDMPEQSNLQLARDSFDSVA